MARKGYADVLEKDPTKSVPREERIGRIDQKLNEPDRRSLQSQIAQDEEAIRASGDLASPGDVSEARKRIAHNKMLLQRDDDLRPKTDSQSNRLFARAKEIESILKDKMPTKREMWPKAGSAEAQRAVRHNLQFQERYSGLCQEWQDLQNKLNPDDPYAQSLELIRPD